MLKTYVFSSKPAEISKKCQNATETTPSAQLTYGLTAGPKNSEKIFMNIVCGAEIVELRIV